MVDLKGFCLGHQFEPQELSWCDWDITGFVLLLQVLEKPWNLILDLEALEKPLKKMILWETA